MNSRTMIAFAAISGFVLVALGAFGAHSLSQILNSKEMAWLHTGLQYQGVHTLAILAIGAAALPAANRWFSLSALFLALGTILFSGSLYFLALAPLKMSVYVTPIGGFCLLIGWGLLLVGALSMTKQDKQGQRGE